MSTDRQNSISANIRDRYSPRAIAGPIPDKSVISAILEGTRWAPSAFNEQPWRFIVATADNEEAFEKMMSCLYEGNQVWCKSAPVLILCVVKNFFDHKKKDNPLDALDLGLAVENLLLETVNQGLVAHPMSGFWPDEARKLFQIPDGYDPKLALALGCKGDISSLPEQLRAMELEPRERKPLSEIAFDGSWDVAWDR